MSRDGGGGGGGSGERRRSARISALEEACKSEKKKGPQHQHQHQRQERDGTSASTTPAMHESGSGQPLPERKRGRKKKRLEDVVVTSVAKNEGNPKHEDTPINTDQRAILPCLQRLPEKRILEFILDILQRRDTHEIFAEPVDPEEVEDYYEIVKEPMDFGTMRAKLQEGMYTNLEQFEHDVFLISSNAMLFNSSTTIYFRQARAIHELAKKVFHALKTDPENFELEFSLARKRPGRKPQGDPGGSRTRLSTAFKPGGMKIGVSPSGRPNSLNGPSLRRNTQACLMPSSSNFHERDSEIPSGSRDGRSLTLFETERRLTYKPYTSFPSENDSIVSAVYNSSKPLMHVNHGDIGYKGSLMMFVKDLGPTARRIANRKLGLIEAPNCQSLTPAPSIKASNYPIPAPPRPQGPVHSDGFMNGHRPHNLLHSIPGNSNVPDANDWLCPYNDAFTRGKVDDMNVLWGAYRGKLAYADHTTDIHLAVQGDMVPTGILHSSLQGERAPTSNSNNDIYRALHGERAMNTSGMMDIYGPAGGEMVRTRDKVDLLPHAVIREEDITHQNQNTQIQLGSYLPFTGTQSLNSPTGAGITNTNNKYTTMDMMVGSNQPESHSKLFEFMSRSNNCSESSLSPLQAMQVLSLSSQYSGGEGQIKAPAGPSNGANLSQVGQPLEWSRPTPWGPQAIDDFPFMQMRLSGEIPLGQDSVMGQEWQQFASASQEGGPHLDAAASLYERAPAYSHRAEASSSAQCFWNSQQQSLLDIQSPDLALQL